MVVLTVVAQKNGETVFFDEPIPQVRFMRLLSCSLCNSWVTHKGTATLKNENLSSGGIVSVLDGHYDLATLAKKITGLSQGYNGLEAETYAPLGQLVINNFGAKTITLDKNFAEILGTGQNLPLKTTIKQAITKTAYFVHCDLIDKNQNFLNNKKTDLLAKFDVKGRPYEKVSYHNPEQPLRDCSTSSHVRSITLSVRDQDGELFDFKGLPIEFELEIN